MLLFVVNILNSKCLWGLQKSPLFEIPFIQSMPFSQMLITSSPKFSQTFCKNMIQGPHPAISIILYLKGARYKSFWLKIHKAMAFLLTIVVDRKSAWIATFYVVLVANISNTLLHSRWAACRLLVGLETPNNGTPKETSPHLIHTLI